VGASKTAQGDKLHAFLWEDGTMTDLGTLGTGESYAWAINNRGQITGYSDTSKGQTHAFLWEGGVMTDLGTLGGKYSFAYAINDHGQVVGASYTTSRAEHACLWSP
jgi:probable HAF family extracellular repeat protein